MANKIETFEKHELLNTVGCYMVWCYDRGTHSIVAAEEDNIGDDLIMTPYKESYRSEVWNLFWESLCEEEYALAKSFDENHGFFDFLKENGLYGYFCEAEAVVGTAALEAWACGHKIDLETIAVG